MKKCIFIILMMLEICFLSLTSLSALSVITHVPEKYTDVVAGERFYFEIEIKYPENPSRKDLKLNYEISKDGKIIAQSKVLKAIETQASFIDFIVIPNSAEKGMHIIKVKISDYNSLSEEVEASFHVISGSGEDIKIYIFILLGAVGLVGILVVINIFKGKGK
jgi:hypothetical protein